MIEPEFPQPEELSPASLQTLTEIVELARDKLLAMPQTHGPIPLEEWSFLAGLVVPLEQALKNYK